MNKMNKLLLSLSIITISIITIVNNLHDKHSTTTIANIKNAKVFNFNKNNKGLDKDNKNGDTKNWWNQLVYKKSPNDFSNSYIQNDKPYKSGHIPGWDRFHSSNNNENMSLDFISFSPAKINQLTPNPKNYPTHNYNAGKEILFGNNFGLLSSLGFYVTSGQTNKPNPTYSYKINCGGINSSATSYFNFNSEGNNSSAPKNNHTKESGDSSDHTSNAYEKDFDYFNLWENAFKTPPTSDSPKVESTSIDKVISMKNFKIEGQSADLNGEYNTVSFVTHIGSGESGSDNIITEYSVTNNSGTKLYLVNDKLYNYKFVNNSSTDWRNDGYLFYQQIIQGNNTTNISLAKYLKYGYFPIKLPKDESTIYYEPVDSRSELENNNPNKASLLISNALNDAGDNVNKNGKNFLDYNVDRYKKWGYNISGNINVTNSISIRRNTTANNPRKYLYNAEPDQTTTPIFNSSFSNHYYYHFLTIRGPSQYSGVNRKDFVKDDYKSYSPYKMYTSVIGGKTNDNFSKLLNPSSIFYSLNSTLTSAISDSTDLTQNGTYVDDSTNIQYKDTRVDPNDILNKLDKFNFSITPFSLPPYAIVLIVIGILLLLWISSQYVFKKKQLKQWKKSKTGIKGYGGKDYELIDTGDRTQHEAKIKDYLSDRQPGLIKKMINKIFRK